MVVCGLTGGIGAGKTFVSSMLEEFGWKVIDTDVIARQVVEPGSQALAEITELFGPDLINAEGQLERRRLGDMVFNDSGKLKQLEAVLHPKIRKAWKEQLAAFLQSGNRAPGVAVVIPLLFETGVASEFDAALCVGCSARTQFNRLQKRGWNPEHVESRVRAQWKINQKMDKADFVIWNEFTPEVCKEQLKRIVQKLSSLEKKRGCG
jgi:dephospho-CoA kinase